MCRLPRSPWPHTLDGDRSIYTIEKYPASLHNNSSAEVAGLEHAGPGQGLPWERTSLLLDLFSIYPAGLGSRFYVLTLSMFGPLIHICNYNVQLEARLACLFCYEVRGGWKIVQFYT